MYVYPKNDETFTYTDGGRGKAGYRGLAGDCVVRALAVATQRPYKEVYKELAQANKDAGGKRSARDGVPKHVYKKVFNRHGWHWVSAPKFEGRKARYFDLPPGTHIASMANHLTTVVDGVVHDAWDCRAKMVYGYWTKK